MLLMGLIPAALSLFASQAGEDPTFTPVMVSPEYLGHAKLSSTSTDMVNLFSEVAAFPVGYGKRTE
jgi:hypothetical protein